MEVQIDRDRDPGILKLVVRNGDRWEVVYAGVLPESFHEIVQAYIVASMKAEPVPTEDPAVISILMRKLSLTEAQARVLALLVAYGESNKEIAARIGRAENTVKSQLHRIFAKMRVRHRSEALVRAKQAIEEARVHVSGREP